MKNTMYAYTYTVGLSIMHPTRELSYLADELNKIPNAVSEKGLGKDYAKNRTLPYEDIQTSDISFEIDGGWYNALLNESLPEAVEKLIDATESCRVLLMDVVNTGGEIRCSVGWHMESNIGTEFSTELIQKLAALKIQLGVSVYVGDEQQLRHIEQVDRMAEKIRTVLHKYDPSKVVDKSAPLSELHYDPYQDLFDLMPLFVKGKASKEVIEQELREELAYFDRTNTAALKDFTRYEALASELSELVWV